MQRGTPKSFYSTELTKMTITGTPIHFDPDVEIEKEYLQKLKNQRIKTEKLFHQYKALVKERQNFKSQKEQLQNQINILRHKQEQREQENRLQIVKLQFTIEQHEKQHQTLKNELNQFSIEKMNFQKKKQQLERQLEIYQQERFHRGDMIQYLQSQISRLQRDHEKTIEEKERQMENFKEKIVKLQFTNKKIQKQLILQKQGNFRGKSQWQLQRQKMQKAMTTNLQQIKKIRQNYENELADKDRLYQIVLSQLQQNKMFWSVKIDEKNKEIHGFRRNLEHSKEEIKKYKMQKDIISNKLKEKEDMESKVISISDCLKQSLDQLSTKLTQKELQYSQLNNTYVSFVSDFHSLQAKNQELERALKLAKDTGRRLQENCEQYLKIIEKLEAAEQRRWAFVETQYEQIQKMQKIFEQSFEQ